MIWLHSKNITKLTNKSRKIKNNSVWYAQSEEDQHKEFTINTEQNKTSFVGPKNNFNQWNRVIIVEI